ncbi:MAG: Mur ligase family protein, partial [Lentimicrobiaceae bacterium]|nr:Mur ligase family protein [Lentimicrobiaceae bacterium]
IAGTNGKGSVAHLLASYFQELGWKTGLFTSPHLIDYRERIKINGKEISEQTVIDFFAKYQDRMAEIAPSFFEMTTILAFDTFAAENVDIAIIETGLGGRLDATNILSPILSVITNISLEHTKMLGNTLAEIAREKAGIIKENRPVVIGEYHPETFPVFEETAKAKNAPLFLAEAYQGVLEFGGIYQRKNLGTAIKCVKVLEAESRKQKADLTSHSSPLIPLSSPLTSINPEEILKNLPQTTGFMGRWQIISQLPLTICDVAHNPAGIELVMKQLQQLPHNGLHIILGFVNDKDIEGILSLLPKNAQYYACQAQIERALPAEELHNKLSSVNLKVIKIHNVLKAYEEALKNAKKDDVIFIGGSFFVVGEFLKNSR